MNDLTPSGAPLPDDSAGSSVLPETDKKDTQGEQPRQRNTGQILSEQQCLAGLSQLPSLLATDWIKVAKSNALRGVYKDLLQYYERTGRDATQSPEVDEDTIALLRKNPVMLKHFEPLLNDDQLNMILRKLNDDDEKN